MVDGIRYESASDRGFDTFTTSRRVLILGGTTEASRLAAAVADLPHVDALLSLAGRTRRPAPSPLKTRVGGFGGIAGLCAWLRNNDVHAVIDATHPFAAGISANAAEACRIEAVPRLRFTRAPWQAQAGDQWREVANLADAATALGPTPRRVFLPLGRTSLQSFAAAPWHFYLVRSVDLPDDLAFLPDHVAIAARPPFSRDAERELFTLHRIETIVTKNSGGDATAAKLASARDLQLPVIMVARPPEPDGAICHDLDTALAFVREPRCNLQATAAGSRSA